MSGWPTTPRVWYPSISELWTEFAARYGIVFTLAAGRREPARAPLDRAARPRLRRLRAAGRARLLAHGLAADEAPLPPGRSRPARPGRRLPESRRGRAWPSWRCWGDGRVQPGDGLAAPARLFGPQPEHDLVTRVRKARDRLPRAVAAAIAVQRAAEPRACLRPCRLPRTRRSSPTPPPSLADEMRRDSWGPMEAALWHLDSRDPRRALRRGALRAADQVPVPADVAPGPGGPAEPGARPRCPRVLNVVTWLAVVIDGRSPPACSCARGAAGAGRWRSSSSEPRGRSRSIPWSRPTRSGRSRPGSRPCWP